MEKEHIATMVQIKGRKLRDILNPEYKDLHAWLEKNRITLSEEFKMELGIYYMSQERSSRDYRHPPPKNRKTLFPEEETGKGTLGRKLKNQRETVRYRRILINNALEKHCRNECIINKNEEKLLNLQQNYKNPESIRKKLRPK
ncbi:MAG: hypothetical protein ACTSXL_02550 [Alphaproteobacteria bacterium]